MPESALNVVGCIGRTKRGKPTFAVPGLEQPLRWCGEAPKAGTEMTVSEFLAWIDRQKIKLSSRHLIDPETPPSKRQAARQRAKEIRRRKQEVLGRRDDQPTAAEQLEIYGAPTAKQLVLLAKLKYSGPAPRTTIEARDLIGGLLEKHGWE